MSSTYIFKVIYDLNLSMISSFFLFICTITYLSYVVKSLTFRQLSKNKSMKYECHISAYCDTGSVHNNIVAFSTFLFVSMSETLPISRPAFSKKVFNDLYTSSSKDDTILSRVRKWGRHQAQCSSARLWKIFIGLFPVLDWLPKYRRKYIVGDLIAGWTVGIIRIPQGMAYALLAGVQPVYGLYSCFFPVLLWFVFSTSRHTSVGTMAVVCLMIQNLISIHIPEQETSVVGGHLYINGDPANMSKVPPQFIVTDSMSASVLNVSGYNSYLLNHHEKEKIQLACSATLLVGIIQLLMAVLRLGFLTTLLSDPVIQGFTTGAAFHVMASQVKYMFGLNKSVGKYGGPLSIFKTLADIFRSLPHSNVPDVVISLLSLPTLLVVKYLNERYKKRLRNIPVPVELILVVIATIISYFCNLDDAPFNVNVVKTIPTGFPTFSVPIYTNLWSKMVTDCLIMAVISVAISLSLTKIYSDKHGYEVNANQEILALGICNTIPAFLSSFAVAASLSRSAIQESSGGKTQLVSVLSSVLMLIVLLWLAPLFEPVPKSVLACIIIVALKSLFLQFTKLKELWPVSKVDFLIWIVTCTAVVLLGVDLGLAVGVVMAIVALVFRIQHPKHAILGRIVHTELYADRKKYKDAYEIPGIKIFHYADSPSFTNKDAFRNSLYHAIGCNPTTMLKKLEKLKEKEETSADINMRLIKKSGDSSTGSPLRRLERESNTRKRSKMVDEDENALLGDSSMSILGFNVLILDATMWSFIDSTASREILQIIDKFQALAVTVVLAGPSTSVLKTLNGCGLPSRISDEGVFVSVHEAVIHAEKVNQEKMNRNEISEDPYSSMPGYPGFDSLAL